MEPHQKRSRSESGGYWSNQQPPRGVDHQFSSNSTSNQECKRFKTPDGCPFGSTCRFRHVPAADGGDTASEGLSSGGKPKPCMKFFSTTGCPFGESCHFTHYVPGGLSSLGLSPVVSFSAAPFVSQKKTVAPMGDPSTTVNGYKTKLCKHFLGGEGCRFGDKCHFAHGEGDLRPPNNQSQGNHHQAPSGGPRMGPPGYNNGGSTFSNTGPFGNTPNLTSQGNGQAIPPGGPVGGYSANYAAGSTGENLQVY